MLGTSVGYFLLGIIADNCGRRKPFIFLQAIGLIGYLTTLFASDINMVAFGIFMAGFGSQTCYGISFSILKEILSNEGRQKM